MLNLSSAIKPKGALKLGEERWRKAQGSPILVWVHPDVRRDLALSLFPVRIIFPAANSDDSIPFAAESLFGNLTEWDCTNEDHRPAICFRVGRMHWQPAERRNEANCGRPMRPARSRCVCSYVMTATPI